MSRPPFRRLVFLIAVVVLAGCATTPKPTETFPVKISSSPEAEITSMIAREEPYGLVVTGQISLAPNLQIAATHSVDVVITGPDGTQIRKFTSQYFPAPKIQKKKRQRAHFTVVTWSVPPAGSVITVSVTPEPAAPGEPREPAPGNP